MHPPSCAPFVTAQSSRKHVHVSYHGERHAVNLMFVFGLVLSEGTVPERERRDRQTDDEKTNV